MWYHGTLDRQEAEILIRNFSNENGTFLVRFSDRNTGATVLTLLNEDLFFNYIIRKQVGGKVKLKVQNMMLKIF